MPRRKLWMPFTSGPLVQPLVAGTNIEYVIPSIVSTEQAKEYDGYTVIRVVGALTFYAVSTMVVTYGLIMKNELLGVGVQNPEDAPLSQWLWFGEALVGASVEFVTRISYDVHAQRKLNALEWSLFLQVSNRDLATTVNMNINGRALVLLL